MALLNNLGPIVTTGTGASDFFFLYEKEEGNDWTLSAFASAWGSATLQNSADGVNWGDTLDQTNTVVTFAANKSVRVPGNMYYRLNVATHTAVMTLIPK